MPAFSSFAAVRKAFRERSFRISSGTVALAAVLLLPTPRAFAVNKEMVQLQTQVQQLQDAVARLQQSNDERMGVMKDLVQQTADSVNKMSVTVQGLQQKLGAGTEANGAKLDQVSGQVQSLNDSLDELKARMHRIELNIAEVQSAQQSLGAHGDAGSAAPASTAAPAGIPMGAAADVPAARTPKGARTSQTPPAGFPSDAPADDAPAAASPRAGKVPPVTDLYQTAFGDYNGAKYKLATAEFQDVILYYPENNLAGNAYFYLGEMLFKSHDYGPATQQYDKVIEGFPSNPKVPSAQLRKGQALIAMKQADAGARELRSLVARYPNSPEAVQARARLADLGVAARR